MLIEPNAALGDAGRLASEILPVIDIEGEHADPVSIGSLFPYAFVDEFAVIRYQSVNISEGAVGFQFLDE